MSDNDRIWGADQRLQLQVELLEPVAQWIPDMKAVWSIHDTPSSIVSWDHRAELIERFEDGECEYSPTIL
jgi:hypothetical protein